MNRVVLISIWLTGCFYTDPINQRPSVAIHNPNPGVPLHRGDSLKLDAVADDPDGDAVALQWRAYACTQLSCDPMEFDSGTDTEFLTTLHYTRADPNADPVFDTVQIVLDAHDNLGATARPSQTLDITLDDYAPTLELRTVPSHAVFGTSTNVFARIGDVDDLQGPSDDSKISLSVWMAEGPASAGNFSLTDDVQAPSDDPQHFQLGKSFTPTAIGDWTIDLIATDPQGASNEQMLPVHVDADHAPCLAQWDPTATTVPNTTIPITDPTLFQVLVVDDDLDPYPSVSGNPILGTTEFHWSMVPPGGMRQQLTGVTGSGVALDPDSYTPGDIVELRVEIQDRTHTPVNCPDTDLTCSVISDPSCLQRLTWRVEVR